MRFHELKLCYEQFRSTLHDITGEKVISDISVEEPTEPINELYFVRLILWTYCLLFEAGAHPINYVGSLIQSTNPSDFRKLKHAKKITQCLRTVLGHNMDPNSRSDADKRTTIERWAADCDGPQQWINKSSKLTREVSEAIDCLVQKCRSIEKGTSDYDRFGRDLLYSWNRQVPPHEWDRFIEKAASELGLDGFDAKAYREKRLDDWRGLTLLFPDKQDAEKAISRAIAQELRIKFGNHDI